MHTIPCIPGADLFGSGADRQRAIETIREAATTIGFFQLADCFPQIEVDVAFRYAQWFFELPDDVKALVRQDDTWRGWEPAGGQSLGTTKVGEWKESFRIGREPSPRVRKPDAAWAALVNEPNKWPEKPREFRAVFEPFWRRCADLGTNVLAALEDALGDTSGSLLKGHQAQNYTLRLLHYLPNPEAKREWCGEHTDWTELTFVFQSKVGGLYALTRGGERIAIPPMRGHIVVNVGNFLEARTGGKLVSTPHGVDPNAAGEDRISFAYFMYPDFSTTFDFGNGPVTAGDFVLGKFRGTAAK